MALTEKEKKKIEEEELYRAKLRDSLSKGVEVRTGKNRITAAILAFLFGGLGIHKFYLGKAFWGIMYLVFSWTFIPLILGIIEGLIF